MTNRDVESNVTAVERSVLSVLGPGILYAAAAVGVSHLVQATRAGANFGLGLTLVIVLACIIKYPALRFGGDYAAATGKSLITSYRDSGWWAIVIYALAQVFSMVFIVAAISLFTLGLLQTTLSFSINPIAGVSLLLTAVIILLLSGHYHLLEKLTKYTVVIFTTLIFIAVVLVAGQMDWHFSAFALPEISGPVVLFIIALIGFMPTPTDGGVLQSLWICAKADETGRLPSLKDAQLDFNVGYITSVFLGLCFLVLGAGVMHSAGVEIATSNQGFSSQLLQLFTDTIGSWSFPLIAIAAVFVMLSTLFTVVDGMTRIVVSIAENTVPHKTEEFGTKKLYKIVIVGICVLSVLVLVTLLKSFATFMDLTSVIVFVTSPVVAYLNHRAMWSDRVPEEFRPSTVLKIWSLAGITMLLLLTMVFFYYRFVA